MAQLSPEAQEAHLQLEEIRASLRQFRSYHYPEPGGYRRGSYYLHLAQRYLAQLDREIRRGAFEPPPPHTCRDGGPGLAGECCICYAELPI